MAHKRPGPGYAWILGLLLLLVLVVPVAAGTGTWTTNGPFATGLGNQVIYALAISPDGSVVYCGTGSSSVFSYAYPAAAPAANFAGTPSSGTCPLAVQFNDTSTGSPTSWSWDFGDGTTSAEQNATHMYTSAGSFTVSLTASNTAGSNSLSRSGYITVTQPLTANFTGTPASGTAPLAVTFTDTSAGTPTSWSWDFGDGNTSTSENPSHTYSSAGAFTVRLTITRGSSTATKTANDYITVSSDTQPLVANFAASPASGTKPLAVAFTDESAGGPVSWSWDFGDGGTSTEQDPTHTYTGTGSFSVSLTATNGTYSNTTTRNNCITVTTAPVTTATTAVPTNTVTTLPVTTTTTSPVTTATTVPVTTVTTEGTSDDTSADSGRGTSFVVTSPGAPAGDTMSFAVNEPLSAGSTDYSYAIMSVDMILSETLGSTDLIVTDAGATSHAPDDRAVAGIAAISPVAVNPSAISSGTITFAVSGTWLADHGLTSSDIVLMRFHDGAWVELSTTYQYVDGNAYYFTATTPGFSYFAIAARDNADAADTTGRVTTPTAAPRAAGSTMAAMTPSVVKTTPSYISATVTTAAAVAAASGTNAGGSGGFPVTAIALVAAGILALGGVVWYIRRWWIRRQNPALFREYD
ncbi:MAG: PKD domain-containing protein [Methanoregula sp.]